MRWQIELVTLGAGDHVVLRVNSVSRFTRSSKISNRNSPCSKRSIRGIRLHKLLRKSRATDYFNWRNGVPREHRSKDRPIGTCYPSEAGLYAESWAPSTPVTVAVGTTMCELKAVGMIV